MDVDVDGTIKRTGNFQRCRALTGSA